MRFIRDLIEMTKKYPQNTFSIKTFRLTQDSLEKLFVIIRQTNRFYRNLTARFFRYSLETFVRTVW